MRILKNIKILLTIALLATFFMPQTQATDDCFEGVNRSVFKFNMAFDDIILEPIANGYNKLPSAIKNGTSNFTSNIATSGTFLSISFKA